MAKPEGFKRGKVEPPDRISQMGQGMSSGIAVVRRIGQSPDAQSIDHQHNHTINHRRTIPEACTRLTLSALRQTIRP